MGADLRIAAALDLCPIVHVLSGASIAAVHGPMIDRHLARWARDPAPTSRRRASTSATSTLNETAQQVVRNGSAISLIVTAQLPLHHVEQLTRDDGSHLDRYPLCA